MVFSYSGFLKGLRAGLPIAVGVASYGLVFGILSRQAGMDLFTSLFMSASVFAGASQFVALDLWISPLPVAALIITTFVVNIRHFLMGTVLVERFKNMTRLQTYLSLFFLVDEAWAYSMAEWRKGDNNAALLLGCGFCLFLSWTLSTLAGNLLGAGPVDPARWGMDFAFTAIFIFLAVGLWQGKKDLIPWLVAGLVAVTVSRTLPGKWYILAGSLSGSITGALIHER